MNLFYRIWYLLTFPIRLLVGLPGRVPQRLLRLSVPARVALLLFVFLLVSAIGVPVVSHFLTKNAAAWGFWAAHWGWIVALVFVIPFVAYQALKLWLEGEKSRFPDIDYAWKAGLAELSRNGLDLTQIPIFLILGAPDEAQEKALFDAMRVSLRVREVPPGPAALHWYANPEGVYIVCPGASSLSKLAAIGKAAVAKQAAAVPMSAEPHYAPDPLRGTVMNEGGGIQQSGVLRASSAAAASPLSGSAKGTLVWGGTLDYSDPTPSADPTPVVLSQADSTEQEQRLEYVCRLIRRLRQPLCPINGILTLLPYGLIQRSPREGIEVQRAAKRDLAAVRRTLLLRFPAIALVTGMEAENGFLELVRRVGREKATGQRFGKGYNLWNPPLSDRVEALNSQACGAFEVWAYILFRERDSLTKPGNTKLYALLCKVRRNIQGRLAKILTDAFSAEGDPGKSKPLLFSGCYFAATGETDNRQAFVKAVLEKLPEDEENVEWTSEAVQQDMKYRRWAGTLMAADVLLFLGLVGMLVYKFWR